MMTHEIDKIESLLPQLDYNPESGRNYWTKSGKRAGSKRKGGLRIISTVYEHRINFYREYGYLPEQIMIRDKSLIMDDGCLKMTPDNLRPATLAEIGHFRRPAKGVYYCERSGSYTAQIKKNGVKHYLGSFDNEGAARRAYESASVKLYGEF